MNGVATALEFVYPKNDLQKKMQTRTCAFGGVVTALEFVYPQKWLRKEDANQTVHVWLYSAHPSPRDKISKTKT